MKSLLILGAGGHGKVVADCAKATGKFAQIAFLDGQYPQHPGFCGWQVIGKLEEFLRFQKDFVFFVAIGNNDIRREWQRRLEKTGCEIATIIHPSSIIGTDVQIGKGSLVVANAVINILSRIGEGCIINTAASIDHDCTLGDFVHVAPGVRCAGTVTLGDNVFMGVASAAIPAVNIEARSIVGAGATVLCDLPANVTAVGTPAQIIKKN